MTAFDNPIIWIIIVIAVFCYAWIIEMLCFTPASEEWEDYVNTWTETLRILLSTLPLLGLLGTIAGLLQTFFFMSNNHGFAVGELISNGMADALFTTQMGLLLVVPGWILYATLASKLHNWSINKRVGDVQSLEQKGE